MSEWEEAAVVKIGSNLSERVQACIVPSVLTCQRRLQTSTTDALSVHCRFATLGSRSRQLVSAGAIGSAAVSSREIWTISKATKRLPRRIKTVAWLDS